MINCRFINIIRASIFFQNRVMYAPSNLYHPVLPYRYGGKLTFPFCRTCVETHTGQSPEQRSLQGLRQHLAENETGSVRSALGCWRRSHQTPAIPARLRGTRGDSFGRSQHRKEPWKTVLGQGRVFYPSFWNKNGWYGMHSQHSVHSAPGSRMDGMAFCPLRNRNAE